MQQKSLHIYSTYQQIDLLGDFMIGGPVRNINDKSIMPQTQTEMPMHDNNSMHRLTDGLVDADKLQSEWSDAHNCHQLLTPQEPQDLNFLLYEDNNQRSGAELHLFYRLSEDIQEEKIEEASPARQRSRIRTTNDTKNIPKNFGKGIISFIQQNQKKIRPFIISQGLNYSSFVNSLKKSKQTINTIAELRQLWTSGQQGKVMRTLSNLFFRKYSLAYIFNSRISSFGVHIKYRQALWQALKNPDGFNHIKTY